MIFKKKKEIEAIRVRMAPSPTGYFHIGSARSALFNWLFAKHNKGAFIIRIEDTDKERSKLEYEKDILESLNWLGLDYDEGPTLDGKEKGDFGPYRQSERTEFYKKYLEKLLENNNAYFCYCNKEDLENMRQSALSGGKLAIYNGKCRSLSKEDLEKMRTEKRPSVIRFKMKSEKISFKDLIRGEVSFDTGLMGDIVIAKNLEEPLYNFSATVDDFEMKISHVIRGEEHLANTPKQIALARALEIENPKFAHIPLILNKDKSKMSKRFGDSAVKDYKEKGYLADALINFLALLGWHPAPEQSTVQGGPRSEREIFSLKELVREFELKRVQKGGAIFNIEKLNWFNSFYLRKKSDLELLELLKNNKQIPDNWLEQGSEEKILKVIEEIKQRMEKFSDFKELASIFFEIEAYSSKLLIWKDSDSMKTLENLEKVKEIINSINNEKLDKSQVEEVIMPLANDVGRGALLWPLRVAVSGRDKSPGPFEIIAIIGKKETLDRISVAVDKLSPQLDLGLN